MNNRKIILSLYKTKLKLCVNHGYILGTSINVSPNFNLGKCLIRCNKIRNKEKKATYIMSHIRQGYKDNMYKDNYFMNNIYIDEGFHVLRNLNQLLNKSPKKKNKNIVNLEDEYIVYDFFEEED